MHPTLFIDCNAAFPAPLVWSGDTLGMVLMLSGVAVAVILATLVLRARRRRAVQPLPVLKPVQADAPLRRVAA